VARALGAQPLEEETSTSFSFGFTSRPRSNVSITLDVFSIDIDDRIVISGQFQASNPQIAPLLAPFGVNAAQFFTNAIDTSTEGADLVVAYSTEVGEGSLALTGAANWNKTEIAGPVRTPPELVGLQATLFPLIDRTYVERAQPRQSYNLSAKYSRGRFAVLGRLNRFGSVGATESNTDPARFQEFSGKWIADLDLSYRIGDVLTLHVGGNNIFDTYPDENIPSNSFNGIFVYPRRTAPFGFNGGFYYTRLSFRF
jgi:iron complex outermembrane receptor protein